METCTETRKMSSEGSVFIQKIIHIQKGHLAHQEYLPGSHQAVVIGKVLRFSPGIRFLAAITVEAACIT